MQAAEVYAVPVVTQKHALSNNEKNLQLQLNPGLVVAVGFSTTSSQEIERVYSGRQHTHIHIHLLTYFPGHTGT